MRLQAGNLIARLTGVAAAVLLGAAMLVSGAARAELPAPTGDVVLVVKGQIGETNVGNEAHFDREMLMALGMHSLSTHNPFETGIQDYEGILFSDLMNTVDADGETLVCTALDGYSIEIPLNDVMSFPVMLAMKWNGKIMRPRNKGPLWVIYPIDQYPELRDEVYSIRTIWQLIEIDVR